MRKERCSHLFFWITISFLVVILIISLAMNGGFLLSLAVKRSTIHLSQRAEDEFPRFTEKWSYGSGAAKVVRIPVKGIIVREAGDGLFFPQYDKIELILSKIRAAKNDSTVKGLIVEVDSPGGAITPSDEIYHALQSFKESDPNRKIVVFTKDLAASGGYYVAMAADGIIAAPTAIVGSIGVIMQTLNWRELSEKVGISDTTIKSGKNKDLLNPFREVSSNQVALLQSLVDSMHKRFSTIVGTQRGFDQAQLTELADGRIFSAEEALDQGLIDQIGYWDEVVKHLTDLLDEVSVKIVRYERKVDLFDWVTEMRSPLQLSSWIGKETPRLMYLWKP